MLAEIGAISDILSAFAAIQAALDLRTCSISGYEAGVGTHEAAWPKAQPLRASSICEDEPWGSNAKGLKRSFDNRFL